MTFRAPNITRIVSARETRQKLIKCLPAAFLLYFAGEILWRRWVWRQLPTQVSPLAVYALVVLDVVLALVIFRGRVDQNGKKLAH